jgi:hypothetical protein
MPHSVNQILSLTSAALQYGPFLFALLFIVLVPPYAHVVWRRSYQVAESDPGRSQLIDEGRRYFRYAWSFGMILVLFSVGWWIIIQIFIITQSTKFAETGYVIGLKKEDNLRAFAKDDNVYLVPSWENDQLRYHFVYLSNSPPSGEITLIVYYTNSLAAASGQGVPQIPVTFKLMPGKGQYQLVTDPSNPQKMTIMPITGQ